MHLVCYDQFWLPYLKKDTVKLETVHKRTTEMIKMLEQFPYKEWLRHLEIFSAERGQMRVDLFQVNEIMHGQEETISSSQNARCFQNVTQWNWVLEEHVKGNILLHNI